MNMTRQGPMEPVSQFRNSETGPTGARYATPEQARRDHKKESAYAALELRHREQIIGGLRDHGVSYRDIAQTLGLRTSQVELVLGEAARLHSEGFTVRDIAERTGLSRSSVHRLVTDRPARAVSSERQMMAVTVLADMYGLQIDVLALFLGIHNHSAYRLVRQLRSERLVLPELIEGRARTPKWVVPTRQATASYLGWMPAVQWRPPAKDAEHYRAVAQARIMLVGTDLDAWVSERRLRHDAEIEARHSRNRGYRSTGHIHDGRFLGVVAGTYGWWALEVELTVKSRRNLDEAMTGAIRTARDAQPEPMVGVLYLVRGADVRRVVNEAFERVADQFATLDMELAIRDFDTDWNRYLTTKQELHGSRLRALPGGAA